MAASLWFPAILVEKTRRSLDHTLLGCSTEDPDPLAQIAQKGQFRVSESNSLHSESVWREWYLKLGTPSTPQPHPLPFPKS